MENKKLSARQINGLLKKYEARKKGDYSNSKRLTKEDYIKQTDRNYKDGDRN